MGKFDSLKVLKNTSACRSRVLKMWTAISPGESYYKEHIQDKFLHF